MFVCRVEGRFWYAAPTCDRPYSGGGRAFGFLREKATAATFCHTSLTQQCSQYHLLPERLQRENFWVKHYAGKVKYTVHGWVERNMDRVPESFSSTLGASTHKVTHTEGADVDCMLAATEGLDVGMFPTILAPYCSPIVLGVGCTPICILVAHRCFRCLLHFLV